MSQWFQLSSVLFSVADTFIWLNFRFAGGPLPASDEHVAKIQKPLQGFFLHPISPSIIHLLLFTQVKLILVLSHFNFTVKFNFCLILLSLSWMVKILHLISLSITYHLITLQVTSRPRLNLFSFHFQSLITFNITCPGDKLFIPLSITFHPTFHFHPTLSLSRWQAFHFTFNHFSPNFSLSIPGDKPAGVEQSPAGGLPQPPLPLLARRREGGHHLLPLHDQGATFYHNLHCCHCKFTKLPSPTSSTWSIDKDLNYFCQCQICNTIIMMRWG